MPEGAEERWRQLRDWTKASVELEGRLAIDELESSQLEKAQTRRDTFEEVWGMILAFEQDYK